MGWQRRPSTPLYKGRCADWSSLAKSPKNNCDSDGKGAENSWVSRPTLVLYLCIHNSMLKTSGKASKALPTTRNKAKDRSKGQRPRGVFRVWVPGWHTHIQHKEKEGHAWGMIRHDLERSMCSARTKKHKHRQQELCTQRSRVL